MENVFPDWVETGPDGYKRVTVRGPEALVVEGLKEMRTEKDTAILRLNQKLEEARSENAALKSRLEKLEQLLSGGAR